MWALKFRINYTIFFLIFANWYIYIYGLTLRKALNEKNFLILNVIKKFRDFSNIEIQTNQNILIVYFTLYYIYIYIYMYIYVYFLL